MPKFRLRASVRTSSLPQEEPPHFRNGNRKPLIKGAKASTKTRALSTYSLKFRQTATKSAKVGR